MRARRHTGQDDQANTMVTLPNILSAARGPLAFLFLLENTTVRIAAIVVAMATDSIDGFLARRSHSASQLGALLDPLMDKFFMLFALTVAVTEQRILVWQMATLLSRDFAVATFGAFLGITGGLSNYRLRSIWVGKVSTSLQFVVLIALMKQATIPSYVYHGFIVLGITALAELFYLHRKSALPAS